jgi:hypothetical protein
VAGVSALAAFRGRGAVHGAVRNTSSREQLRLSTAQPRRFFVTYARPVVELDGITPLAAGASTVRMACDVTCSCGMHARREQHGMLSKTS